MGIVFMATADTGDTTTWTTANIVSISSVTKRTGVYSYLIGRSNSPLITKTIPAHSDYYVKLGINCTYAQYTGDGEPLFVNFLENSTLHIKISFSFYDNSIKVYRNATQIGDSPYTNILSLNTWNCFEIYVKIHDSTGIVTIKKDGLTIITITGVDTQNGGTGIINSINLGNGYFGENTNYVDDIIIRDDAWPGLGGVYVLVPTGVGSNAGWTASAGSPYACVDELPPSATDYIYADSAVVGVKHDFAMSDLVGAFSSIAGVGIFANANLDTAGATDLKTYVISDDTETVGSAVALTTSPAYVVQYLETDPDTATAWTAATINALKVGVVTA